MNVYVLEGHIPYEGSTVLGVYATRGEAVVAALTYDRADREEQFPIGYHYLVNEIAVGAPARDRILDGEEILVDSEDNEPVTDLDISRGWPQQ